MVAETYAKDGVHFTTRVGSLTAEPHHMIVQDATACLDMRPNSLYVGYNSRQDRNRLVEPGKLYDVAEYIVRHAPCNVVVVKETQEEMAERLRARKKQFNM
uniref:UspA domain-containing protein n=1 Tax=Alexandrium andersonii TaxID=327968 RepID=A0A7S2BGZ5_9DINO